MRHLLLLFRSHIHHRSSTTTTTPFSFSFSPFSPFSSQSHFHFHNYNCARRTLASTFRRPRLAASIDTTTNEPKPKQNPQNSHKMKNVVVLGGSYGGTYRSAAPRSALFAMLMLTIDDGDGGVVLGATAVNRLAQTLPSGYRVILIERNTYVCLFSIWR